MANDELLIGRDDAVALIHTLADRPLVTGRRKSLLRPVLVVEGARGTGKSALLQNVSGQIDQRAPYARIDFASSPAAHVPEVLSAVAFALGRYCPAYGTITFPRLAIALLVMQQKLNLLHRRTASSQLTDLLAAERGLNTLRAGLGRAAGTTVNILQGHLNLPDELADVLTEAANEVAQSAFRRTISRRKIRRIALGPAVSWFGHRDRDLTHDPVDRLIELNQWAQSPDSGDHRQAIDEIVWDAFLTDLREHFQSRDADDWRFNSILLMDNGDTRVGQEFVTSLVRNRGTRRDDPDPLAAVVTSTGALLAYRDPGEIAEGDAADAGQQRFRRFRLSDLNENDIIDLIANSPLRTANTPRRSVMIRQLTEGHPATTQLMITTVAQHESVRDDQVTLLTRPEPGSGPNRLSVAERIRADLLGEFPRDALADLVTCAAANDIEHRRALADLSTGSTRLLTQIDELLWPPVGGAGPRVLRRLLLPLLAEREDTHSASWDRVFENLRAGRAAAGDRPNQLYYALAAGHLTKVVVQLEENLQQLDCQEWCELLLAVTAAPRRHPILVPDATPTSPDEQSRNLVRRPAHETGHPAIELVRLVAGLWIVNDPMTDARRRGLHIQIANDYEWLAGYSPQDSVQCYRQNAHRHRRSAEELWLW